MTDDPGAAALTPQVEVGCVVCGGEVRETICSEREVRAQITYLHAFHRRRLKAAAQRDEQRLADRADFTQDYATDVVACGCGLVFRESRPRADAVAAAYAGDEYGRERLEALFAAQRESFRARLDDLARLPRMHGRPAVVEVGSFVGGFLAAARARGWDAIGIDPGAEVVAFCRELGFDVQHAAADDASIADASADCVAIWNTFDQLPNPEPVLRAARRWLRPHGVMVLRMPNGNAFRAAMSAVRRAPRPLRSSLLAAMAWNNLLAFPYLHGYSPAPLARLVARYGFEPAGVRPDTLMRLADADTRTWAVWEERLSKLAWRTVARVDVNLAPWFDAYFTRIE